MPCARKKPGLKPPESETGQAVVMLDVLAFVIMLPFHRSQPRTDASAMGELVAGFESRGVGSSLITPAAVNQPLKGSMCGEAGKWWSAGGAIRAAPCAMRAGTWSKPFAWAKHRG
jgi:hypothetical protein